MFTPSREVLQRPSVSALIIANSIPILGIFFFGWNLFNILFLYWLESAVIGFYTILKMFYVGRLLALPFIIFFIFHFGFFMFGHLTFLMAFFGDRSLGIFISPDAFFSFIKTTSVALVSLFISHGISFFSNFIKEHKYMTFPPNDRIMLQPQATTHILQSVFGLKSHMLAPYKRIIVMHIVIVIGGTLVMILGSPMWALILLTVLKIGADTRAHAKEHGTISKIIQNFQKREESLKVTSSAG